MASRVIPPAQASGTAAEKRDSANLSFCTVVYLYLLFHNAVGFYSPGK